MEQGDRYSNSTVMLSPGENLRPIHLRHNNEGEGESRAESPPVVPETWRRLAASGWGNVEGI